LCVCALKCLDVCVCLYAPVLAPLCARLVCMHCVCAYVFARTCYRYIQSQLRPTTHQTQSAPHCLTRAVSPLGDTNK
uniref:Uncharacterized protein n=1 Tax=Salmo trutta TaxID=8032 RepID=A0A673XWR5_SALTR